MIAAWEGESSKAPRDHELRVKLTAHDSARLRALADIYPGRSQEQILGDLVATALNEVEEALPYVQGKKVIARDEMGDPLYEDIGITPRFEALTRKYLQGSKG
ncbi:type 1 pili tip component [Aestuariirhabdus litorea]|uniref:Type 1 pili tip component n=1 Tax=Aestuariirhabdus litorea TaxID=2528527 RepID=A0A3P3VP92_9GAMM|nr:type 1 pili tip component [Aestuariirhabdus litorea]RWW93639.1 type 1 pili tip component [Endozoicomonadaceae bacterium GTF-13]